MAKPARKIFTPVEKDKYTGKPSIVLKAVEALADCVSPTLGPKIRHVLVDFGYKTELCDDGVTIAQEFELESEFEDAVVRYVREAAERTDDVAGDGTTTTMVILRRLLNEAMASGKTYPEVRAELETACQKAIEQLEAGKRKVDSLDTLLKVARTSMNDEEAAKIVADVVWQSGAKGAVTITDHTKRTMEYERLEGFTIPVGMKARGMVTDKDALKHFAPNANFPGEVAVAVIEQMVSQEEDIVPILQAADERGCKNVTIFCNNLIGEALLIVAQNQMHARFNILAVQIPGQGDKAKDYVQDVCTVTGAKTPVGAFKADDFGFAERVEASFDDTTIIGGKGQKDLIDGLVAKLQHASDESKDPYEKEYFHQRQARLMGGVVVVKVGGVTDTEVKLRVRKVEDAINACKCALEDGVSPGAGAALARIKSGSDMLDRALEEVHMTVCANADTEGNIDAEDPLQTLNVLTGESGNFLDVGVVDATKVLKTVIENAVSIASRLFSVSGIITSKRQE